MNLFEEIIDNEYIEEMPDNKQGRVVFLDDHGAGNQQNTSIWT